MLYLSVGGKGRIFSQKENYFPAEHSRFLVLVFCHDEYDVSSQSINFFQNNATNFTA